MTQIHVERNPAGIEGLAVVTPTLRGDYRGYFMETYNAQDMHSEGLDMSFVQDNQSVSAKGVLRGMHFQIRHPQGKLVRVVHGSVFDVAVDIRKSSATFGKWYGVELSAENRKQLYMEPGFAHGFLVMSEAAVFCYKCTSFYDASDECGLAWNDPSIGISWPGVSGEYKGSASAEGYSFSGGASLIMSDRDQIWSGLNYPRI